MTQSMDFEKEAREIANAYAGLVISRVNGNSLTIELREALRRAFIAGQIDMRVKAVSSANDWVVQFEEFKVRHISPSEFATDALKDVADVINSLPTLDNPIPNSGKD